MAIFARFTQRFQRKVETVQYQAIQLVSVKRSYLERRDKNRFRELVDIPAEINLSEEQVIAATSHAKETLVVAGAGSGKTFVLVGRAKYLVGSARTTEDKILMLAYNKDAAEELSRRTKASGISVTAQTFHGFGNSVIKAPGERTGVAFGDSGEISKFLSNQLKYELGEESKVGLARYFAQELVPHRDYEEFESLNEYAAYVRATIPRTLMDEQVKSHGEWLMSDMMEKVRQTRKIIGQRPIWLQVDGGISLDTISIALDAGADTFVAGSAVFNSPDPAEMVKMLRQRATGI